MSLHHQTPPSIPLHRLQITPPSINAVTSNLSETTLSRPSEFIASMSSSRWNSTPFYRPVSRPADSTAATATTTSPLTTVTSFPSIPASETSSRASMSTWGQIASPWGLTPAFITSTTTTIQPPRDATASTSRPTGTPFLFQQIPTTTTTTIQWPRISDATASSSRSTATPFIFEQTPTTTTTTTTNNALPQLAPARIVPTFLQTATPLYPPPPPLDLTPTDITSYFSMDRGVFSRLVAILHREPYEALRMMALWIYLDRTVPEKFSVMTSIAPLSDKELSTLADETAACLHCMKMDFFPFDPNLDFLPVMQQVAHAPMRLHLFHQHRSRVLEGMLSAIEEICNRALDDILRQCFRPAGFALIRNSIEYGPRGRRNMAGENSGDGSSSGGEVLPDDRTIFLTFSKGYPVAHEELVDFFTKIVGDVFEEIIMENVPDDVQPLFAKMVMRNAAMIPTVLNGQERARFNINGKHVIARKFIPKGNKKQRDRDNRS